MKLDAQGQPVDELAERRAAKRAGLGRRLGNFLTCDVRDCAVTLAFNDRDSIEVIEANIRNAGWLVSPRSMLCPRHSAGHPGKSA